MTDKVRGIRWSAAKALGNIGDARAVRPLISALKSWDFVLRDEAEEALIKIGQPAVFHLIAMLDDEEYRYTAIRILSEIGEPAIPPLIAALRGWAKFFENKTPELYEKIGEPGRIVNPIPLTDNKSLGAQWEDVNWDVKWEAAKALEKMGTSAVKPLIDVLEDRSEDWRAISCAAEALGNIGDSRAIKPLEEIAQNDPDSGVRQTAKEALSKIREDD